MGGKVSMLFALNFPDIIENLIVVDIASLNIDQTTILKLLIIS